MLYRYWGPLETTVFGTSDNLAAQGVAFDRIDHEVRDIGT